jgi:hypothetical protein
MATWDISDAQRGQFSEVFSRFGADVASAPQAGQCFIPTETAPKQEGQIATATKEPQYVHAVASSGSAAPQFGQLRLMILFFVDSAISNPRVAAQRLNVYRIHRKNRSTSLAAIQESGG